MNDLVRALAISAGILFPVVVLIVIVSMAAVRRGEAGHGGTSHDVAADLSHANEPAAAAAVKTPKPAAGGAAGEEISVINILLMGTVLFTLTMLLLFGVSLIGHLG